MSGHLDHTHTHTHTCDLASYVQWELVGAAHVAMMLMMTRVVDARSVRPKRSAGNDQRRDQRLAAVDVVDLPVQLGSHLPRAIRQAVPAQRTRVVRQVQDVVRVASDRPRRRCQGTFVLPSL